MTLIIDAIYENGVFVPAEPVPLSDRSTVRLSVETPDADAPERPLTVQERADRRFEGDEPLARAIADESEFRLWGH